MKFLHISDTHLGYAQYGLKQRAVDIAKSLKAALQHGVQEQVDFILIAGDFFERRDTSPEYFQHAMDCLQVPKDAGIPVYAIAGNHDKAYWSRNSSWLDVLNESGYFHLLSPTFLDAGNVALEPWDDASRTGAIIEPELPVRIIGIPHLGNHTEAMIPKLAELVPRDNRFNIVMMHLGLTGQLPGTHDALDKSALDPMRPVTDYVALGHYHKRYDIDGWIHNPGGTENRSSHEVHLEHGYYIVTVENGQHDIAFHPGLRRDYHTLHHELAPQSDRQQLKEALRESIEAAGGEEPIVRITIKGTLADQYASLDISAIEKELTQETQALTVLLRPDIERAEKHVRFDANTVDRTALEAEVLQQRLQTSHPDLDESGLEALAKDILELKDAALENAEPAALFARCLPAQDVAP